MAIGKRCPCGREDAGKYSIYGRNCRKLFKRWGEERDIDAVRTREENLERWQAPVKARLEAHAKKDRKVVHIKRSAA